MNKKQEKILDFIKNYIEENQYPPSIREIAKGTSIKSTATVHKYLKILEELGYIEVDEHKMRGIRVLE